jgi:hypothetical protein
LVLRLQGSCLSMELGPVLLGLWKLQAKTVPDILSVLTTAASEDVAQLLGGVVIALSPVVVGFFRMKNSSSGQPRPVAAACRRVLPVDVVVEEPPASSPDGCTSLLPGNVCCESLCPVIVHVC